MHDLVHSEQRFFSHLLYSRVIQAIRVQDLLLEDHVHHHVHPFGDLDSSMIASERFDLIPVFKSIIQSRQQSDYSLERFDIWTRSDQTDPLELIEGSQMSANGFDRLVEQSRIKGGTLDLPPVVSMRAMTLRPPLRFLARRSPRGGQLSDSCWKP